MGYDRLPNALLANAQRNPPNGGLFSICCGGAGAAGGEDWATPFVGGQITYVASSDGTIFGYPANPNLGGGAIALPAYRIWGKLKFTVRRRKWIRLMFSAIHWKVSMNCPEIWSLPWVIREVKVVILYGFFRSM